MIDTSKKRPASKPAKKREPSLPKVGQKRLRKTPKKNLDNEDGDDDGDVEMEEPSAPDGDDEDEEGASQAVKKRKVGPGKAKAEKVPKPKKGPKMPTEFKKGKWNPDVELVKLDIYKEHPQDQPFLECCIRCNNRNIIRAANTNNEKLMKAGIDAKNKISQLTAYWSPEMHLTSLDLVIANNSHELLEIMLHPKLHVPQHSTYDAERNVFFQ
jgi:hypothetical protein